MTRYYRRFDGAIWPWPFGCVDLEYALRHGTKPLTREDRQLVADMIQAYAELVTLPARERAKVVRELRKGPNA